MTDSERALATRDLEKVLSEDSNGRFVFCLYVAGATEKSARAVADLRKLCDQRLAGRYELQVVDVYQEPSAAFQEGILVAPTLVRKAPLPVRRLVGDLSDAGKVIAALDIGRGP
jgi:circadian clock protein KaiB